ncbi:MAG: bifunctional demethylmenaquinone methyltransferase/2-methoxy-6-polyprenyl-1,4-benzoquinol methylase UbiE [bacterium]|nr:bifunctional demethylmenaquinone methyltransferase/2-methoxy-6-polyprenyl-1,4-benzoquinol methylase UbiE [bacterium]
MDKQTTEKESSYRIFDGIYKRYDLLNHLLSFGLDIVWRRKLAGHLHNKENRLLLDLACGTGDVMFSLLKHHPELTHAVGCDMSFNMLKRAQEKIQKKKHDPVTSLSRGDAAKIPFADNSFDIVTMAFGIRNVPEPPEVLKEIYRVLKPGGKVAVLEFSLPSDKIIKKLHLFYLRQVLPRVGRLISRDTRAYTYLNQTIETFPYGESFCRWMREAGLKNVSCTPFTFGVASCYGGEK